MQGVLGYDALTTGLAFVPLTLGVGAGATLAPRLARRVSPRIVLVAGMLFATAGEVLLTQVDPGGTYVAQVLPGGMLGAFGLGLSLVPATIVAVQGVPAATSGLASGVLNTSRFVGAALGLAVLSTIAASHTSAEIASGASAAVALTDGFQRQFEVGALFCFAGALAALIMLRPQRAAAAPERVPEAGRA
jgi:MFS family permease